MSPRQPRPANDNGGGPSVWPIFDSLMDRHDLALTDLLLYGVLVAYVHRGVSPRVSDLATVMRVRDPERVRERLRRLIDRGLIRGDHTPGRGQRVRYTLLGPTCSGKAA